MGISIWMHLTYISLYNHVQTKIDEYLIDPIWDDWPFSSSFKLPLYYYYCCDFFLGFKVKWNAETRRKQIPSYPIKIYPKKLVPKVLHSHLFTIFPLCFLEIPSFRRFPGHAKVGVLSAPELNNLTVFDSFRSKQSNKHEDGSYVSSQN